MRVVGSGMLRGGPPSDMVRHSHRLKFSQPAAPNRIPRKDRVASQVTLPASVVWVDAGPWRLLPMRTPATGRRYQRIPKHQSEPASGFAAIRFCPALERGIAAAGFVAPRPIQTQTIPAILEGRDVLGLAHTGTGKTAAFALPLLERLQARPGDGRGS